MNFSIEIIHKGEQSTSAWSGGTTTQLAIYPKTSEYKTRNFIWRLSSACVDIEESTFTSLPGIWRHIMILDGEMALQHEGHHSIRLKPYESDSFSGGWTTKSCGKARDFNLMLSEGNKGMLEAVHIVKGSNISTDLYTPETGFENSADAFYCVAGDVRVSFSRGEAFILQEGELMIVYSKNSRESASIELECISKENAAIVRSKISYI